ncbi:hypothetical protein TKK_0015692 [Trichogramma kaykai]
MLLCSTRVSLPIYGFDCGTKLTNITTISLVDVGDCDIDTPEVEIDKINAQLIQINDYGMVHVRECKLLMKRTIYYCGMHSHVSPAANGEVAFYKEMSRDECDLLQVTGTYNGFDKRIVNIKRNDTTTTPMTFAGKINADKSCEAASSYEDPYGTFDNVVVTGYIIIEIKDYEAKIDLTTNKLLLSSGVTCKASERKCINDDGSNVYWDKPTEDTCGMLKYAVIYEGFIDKVIDNGDNTIMYMLETEEYSFSLLRKSEENICGTTFVRLEHPRLQIVENAHKNTLLRKSDIAAANIDIFAYINLKFVYVEKHLKGQIKRMYQNMKSKCDLERRVIENALSIAAMSPAEAGHKLMKEEGYLAISAGESLHLLRCRKVDLTLRKVNSCYDQLPVKMGNESLFLAPRSRILTTTGKEVICEGRLPVMYKLGQQWFRAMPDLIEGPAPQILKPHTTLTWQYVSPESLAVAGIYSERDTKKLRDMIIFPIERPSILNKIAMGFAGRQIDGNDINIGSFLNEETLNKIA